MKKFKKISTILFLSAYLLIGFNFAGPVLAAAEVKFTPQIGIPGPGSEFQQGVSTTIGHVVGATTTSDLLARYVKAFYNWGLSIVGVLAVLMLMAGGLIWLTSAGDSGKVESAKKMISGSLFGTLLLLGAYFFLNTINPDLAKLPVIEMSVVERVETGCCDKAKDDGTVKITTSNNCATGTSFSTNKSINFSTGKCEMQICCISKTSAPEGTSLDGIKIKFFYSCVNTLKVSCNQINTQDDYLTETTLQNKNCSDVKECNIVTATGSASSTASSISDTACIGKDHGEKPSSTFEDTKKRYCYKEKLVTGKGVEGEPCGNEDYSRCTVDVKINGENCNGDAGKRSCIDGSNVWCCKYTADGTRINK